ncbi:hypothetical protein ACIGXM_29865 [Kitasatospora sp. NPDC052896]
MTTDHAQTHSVLAGKRCGSVDELAEYAEQLIGVRVGTTRRHQRM